MSEEKNKRTLTVPTVLSVQEREAIIFGIAQAVPFTFTKEDLAKMFTRVAEFKQAGSIYDLLMVGDLNITGLDEDGNLVMTMGNGFSVQTMKKLFGEDYTKYFAASKRE